jgi:hypothetical protein
VRSLQSIGLIGGDPRTFEVFLRRRFNFYHEKGFAELHHEIDLGKRSSQIFVKQLETFSAEVLLRRQLRSLARRFRSSIPELRRKIYDGGGWGRIF